VSHAGVSDPAHLDQWWTVHSSGQPAVGSIYGLDFGPGVAFELRMTHADRGWPEANGHYRTSCHCWALYLRILRRYLEFGETVPMTSGSMCDARHRHV
jgi:hypothetical protein